MRWNWRLNLSGIANIVKITSKLETGELKYFLIENLCNNFQITEILEFN